MEDRLLLSSTFQRDGHDVIIKKHDALGGKNGVLGAYASGAIVTTDGKAVYKYFSNGFIVWSPATGAHEVHGKIFARYKQLGGPNGRLGLPISDEKFTRNSDGRINEFQRGMIAFPLGANSANAIYGNIAQKYYQLGGSNGFLGIPIANEISVPSKNYRMNRLLGGIIVASSKTGIWEVHGAILSRYNELGGPNGILGLPTSDEIDTLKNAGRVSKFQYGYIIFNYATGVATERITSVAPTIVLPSMDVLTPPTFREGDVFTTTVMNGIPGWWAYVQIRGDGNVLLHQFPAKRVDVNGNATFALRMPYVLASGRLVDGYTLRVVSGSVATSFPITLHEGQRISLSTDNLQEGKGLTVGIKRGVGGSQVIIQLTKDNNQVVHEWSNLQTDGSGNGNFNLTIPTVLEGASRSDAFGLRVIHGGIVNDQRVVITEGFRVELGHEKTREGHTFPMGIRNAPENADVRFEWYLDGSKRATQKFKTNGDGEGNFTVTTPKVIKGGAQEDKFEIQVSVDGNLTLFVFGMLVKKQTGSSDSGGSQVKTAGPTPNKVNSAPGVIYNTPAEQTKTNARLIKKEENTVLAPPEPELTIQERMKNQLVILCYGSDQRPGDNAGSGKLARIPGMDLVYGNILKVTGASHVMRLWSGDKNLDIKLEPKQNRPGAPEAYSAAIKEITERMKLLNDLGQRIDSIVLAGYSWGGGMALRLANWAKSTYGVEISGLAYVDAVNHGLVGHETDLPDVRPSSILNIYQNIHPNPADPAEIPVLTDGFIENPGLAGFDGTAYYGRYRDYDTDASGVDMTTHLTIDNRMANKVAEFINGVLNGWYGEHRS
ncbi:MAG: hypothetical protein O3A36_03465 [bacterium]|nr:hypothetical protein [bacterium]